MPAVYHHPNRPLTPLRTLPIRVDAVELVELLALTPADQNVMLVGRHGIGKSEILADHYRSRGIDVVALFLGQMSDPGDLIGLPTEVESSGKAKIGRSDFLPPYWWPTDDRPIVLFLDELNRARPEILQSVMELALNKTLAGKRLPEGSRIIAAVNEGDEYQITDLDPALVSRFNVYHFSPTVDDWLRWATRHDLDQRVCDFLKAQPHHLDGIGEQPDAPASFDRSSLSKTPDRRGWARVSNLIKSIESRASQTLTDGHFKLIAGIVGGSATTAFRRSLIASLPVTAEQVLLHFDDHREIVSKLGLSQLAILNEQLLQRVCDGDWCKQNGEAAKSNLMKHLHQVRERKLDEAVAHFVSLISKPKYASAMAWITTSIPLTELVTGYMEGIRVE